MDLELEMLPKVDLEPKSLLLHQTAASDSCCSYSCLSSTRRWLHWPAQDLADASNFCANVSSSQNQVGKIAQLIQKQQQIYKYIISGHIYICVWIGWTSESLRQDTPPSNTLLCPTSQFFSTCSLPRVLKTVSSVFCVLSLGLGSKIAPVVKTSLDNGIVLFVRISCCVLCPESGVPSIVMCLCGEMVVAPVVSRRLPD